MKIGLFGGSFNPPHVCHLMVAIWATSTRDLDQLWFMPTYHHAFSKPLLDFEVRCRMVELAIAGLGDWARVSRVESELGEESRTIDTLRHLMAMHPSDELSLVVGADILLELHRWKEHERLVELAPFHVVGRRGFEVPNRQFALELPQVSSRELRRRLAAGDINYCRERIPRPVLAQIVELGLYDFPADEAEESGTES